MFGQLGWSSGPAKLVGWPLQLKSATAAVFTCNLCLKNKTQRQSHIKLGYFLVQYHFALHPPFNNWQIWFFWFVFEEIMPPYGELKMHDFTNIISFFCISDELSDNSWTICWIVNIYWRNMLHNTHQRITLCTYFTFKCNNRGSKMQNYA